VKAAALLGHQWRRHLGALTALGGGLFAFAWVVTRMAPGPGETEAFERMLQYLPPVLQQMLGPEMLANVTTRGFIAFTGFVHPVILLLMGVWTVRVGAAGLAGEINAGTMDLLASRPVPRALPVGVTYCWLLAGLGILVAAVWGSLAVGLASRRDVRLDPADYAGAAGMLWLLFAAFGAVALALSAVTRSGGSWAAGLVAGSFALDYVARLWEPIGWMRRLSLFRYFRPTEIVMTGVAAVDVVVLAGVAAGGLLAALVLFQRRDL